MGSTRLAPHGLQELQQLLLPELVEPEDAQVQEAQRALLRKKKKTGGGGGVLVVGAADKTRRVGRSWGLSIEGGGFCWGGRSVKLELVET